MILQLQGISTGWHRKTQQYLPAYTALSAPYMRIGQLQMSEPSRQPLVLLAFLEICYACL